MTRRRTVISAL